MREVEPKVFLIGETRCIPEGIHAYLNEIDAPNWRSDGATNDAEGLIELYGRGCYRSFYAGMNPNVTRVREGNKEYIQNLLNQAHGCYDEETEVLTSDGWKFWPDVTMDDYLATLDSEDVITYHKPTKLFADTYNGRMYRVEAQGVDLFVTPNHRMYVCPTTTEEGRLKQTYKFIEARHLDNTSCCYTKVGTWKAAGIGINTAVLELLGFAIGDGYHPRGSAVIKFGLKRERKIAYLEDLCARLGFDYKSMDYNNIVKRVLISKEYIPLFDQIYNEDGDKQIPAQLLMKCSIAELRALYIGLIQSDGSIGKTDVSYSTVSSTLADQMQQLCLHIGLAATVRWRQCRDGDGCYGDRPIATVTVIRRNLKPVVNKYTQAAGRSYWIEGWSGMVYCATVPNGLLYVRRNGTSVWCGNSVLEHCTANFIFLHVSRVLTHELVRHRVGTAISQESLRFVRLDDLDFWMPPDIVNNIEAKQIFEDAIEAGEKWQKELARIFYLDDPNTSFDTKKKITSAMRRIAPEGLATMIGWTANFRTLRHVIETRTDPAAEREIRIVFGKVAEIAQQRWPHVFGDYIVAQEDGLPVYSSMYHKV